MNKLIAIMLAMLLLFSLTACTADPQTQDPETTAPAPVLTYNDAGFWDAVSMKRDDSENPVSELYSEKRGRAMYLELNPDGTGTLLTEDEQPILWQDGSITFADEGITCFYTLENSRLILDLPEYVLVCRKRDESQPLASEQALADFTEFMEVGVPYPYTTGTNTDPLAATVAEATVTSYEVFDSAKDYPAKEGYEWRVVKMEVWYHDEMAEKYGCGIDPIFDDYYNPKLCYDTSEVVEDTDPYILWKYTVPCNGEQMDAYCYYNHTRWGDWFANEEKHVEIICYLQWNFLVPAGYDGSIAGLWDSRLDWADGTYITDYDPNTFLLFRAD